MPVQDFYRELGRLIRDRRKAIPLSQDGLADKVGHSRTSITNIELGRQHVSLHTLYELADALGVEPSALLPEKKFLRKEKVLRFDEKHVSPALAQTLQGLYQRIAPMDSNPRRTDDASDEKS